MRDKEKSKKKDQNIYLNHEKSSKDKTREGSYNGKWRLKAERDTKGTGAGGLERQRRGHETLPLKKKREKRGIR